MSFRRPTIAMLLVGVMVGPATGLAQIAEWFKKGRDAFQEPVPLPAPFPKVSFFLSLQLIFLWQLQYLRSRLLSQSLPQPKIL